jgi:hypothetical protein
MTKTTLRLVFGLVATLAVACGDGSGNNDCPSGQVDCDGVCVNTTYDPTNCGMCGNMCSADTVCNAGNCEGSCGTGTTECDQACVDTMVDPDNCGTCNNTCNAGEVCSQGSCANSCGSGTTECSGMCVDTDVDFDNCGSCGNSCDPGESCNAGQCTTCAPPRMVCGASCVDTQTDEDHCGTCNNTCSNGQACVNGSCAAAARSIAFMTGAYDGAIGQDLYVSHEGAPGSVTKINTSTYQTDTVVEFRTLTNGDIIFLAAQDTEGTLELYRAPAAGGAPVKVSGTLVSGGDVLPGFVISDDESRVLYRADGDTDDVIELYVVNLASPGTATKVNGTLVAGGRVRERFVISADNSTVAYIADETTLGDVDVYAVALASAGTSVRLNPDVTTRPVNDIDINADGTVVVYSAAELSTTRELFSVTVASPGTSTLLDSGTTGVSGFDLNGARVFYVANASTWGLFYVDLSTPDVPQQLNAGPAFNITGEFTVSKDGSRVFYTGPAMFGGANHLLTVEVSNPMVAVDLSAAAGANSVAEFRVRADDAAVVYTTGSIGCVVANGCLTGANGFNDMYFVEVANPTSPTEITNPDSDIFMYEFSMNATGTRVAYRGSSEGFVRAYTVDVATNQHSEIKIDLVDTLRDASNQYAVNSAGTHLYVIGDWGEDNRNELFRFDLANPGTPTRVNGAFATFGKNVDRFELSADGNTIVYMADQDTLDRPELYMVSAASPGTSTKISQMLSEFGSIGGFAISTDSSRLFYTADLTGNGTFELYTVAFAAPTTHTKVNGTLVTSGSVSPVFTVSSDGSFVLYTASQDSEIPELYRVDLSDLGNSTRVSGGGAVNANSVALSHDDAFVTYISDNNLLMVSLSTPGTTTTLNGTLVTNGAVLERATISPDNTMVYYRADQEVDGRVDLYQVPVANPGTSIRVNAPLLTSNNDVFDYQLSPDGTKLVYRADHTSGIDELYLVDLSVPLGTATVLNTPINNTSRDVFNGYVVTNSSVIYRGDVLVSGIYDLFKTDFTSAGTSSQLTTMPNFGDVYGLIGAGSRVIYRADPTDDGTIELFDIPTDGSSPGTRVTPFVGPTDVMVVQAL